MSGACAAELAAALRAAGLPTPPSLSLPASGPPGQEEPAALDWARSGLMWLTGRPGHPPTVPDAPVLARARAAADLLGAASAALGAPVAVDVPELLAGRAALLGLRRGGTVSANGSCRLLRAADGWVAVNLPRPDDLDAVPALLGAAPADILTAAHLDAGSGAPEDDVWAAVTAALPSHGTRDLTERAWLLGLPLAPLPLPSLPPLSPLSPAGAAVAAPVRVSGACRAAPVPVGDQARPLVVDLSSLWAGPLAAHLLGRMGMRVVKVESTHRPDGARLGNPDFYRWLHTGHESTRFDFTSVAGRAGLRQLVEQADVVIEGSRPRALAQLGLDADRWVAARPGRIWLSITGYGRQACAAGPGAGPVAFGDDAAVAGGLVAWDHTPPGGPVPVFCGDAIADPLTGLHAAMAVALCRAGGIGALVDVALRDVAGFVARPHRGTDPHSGTPPYSGTHPPPRPDSGQATGPPPWPAGEWSVTGSDDAGWTVHQAGQRSPVRPPRRPSDQPGRGPAT
ncbi:CoA transferase [Parafrankia elaeagni]|uniref:CoA transferase n=1 Tax=Parafrankia elaeagni TaxID=222534 RepID=UPI0003A5940D|nr:CoA transferase [Parafrankia elaeagni]